MVLKKNIPDSIRQSFIKSNFRRDINDPEYYDLVLNTNYIDIEDAIVFVRKAMEAKFSANFMKKMAPNGRCRLYV